MKYNHPIPIQTKCNEKVDITDFIKSGIFAIGYYSPNGKFTGFYYLYSVQDGKASCTEIAKEWFRLNIEILDKRIYMTQFVKEWDNFTLYVRNI